MHPVDGDGHVLRLYLPSSSPAVADLERIDEQIVSQTLENNASWFPNRLSEEQVRTYFRPSFQKLPTPSLAIYVSSWKDPVVYVDGVTVENTLHELGSVPKDATLRVQIEPMGVSFFRQKFGMRWLLRKAWIETSTSNSDDGADLYDRDTIEDSWDMEIKDIRDRIGEEKAYLVSRLSYLDTFYEDLRARFEAAKKIEDPKEWNTELENLSKSIIKYRSGAV